MPRPDWPLSPLSTRQLDILAFHFPSSLSGDGNRSLIRRPGRTRFRDEGRGSGDGLGRGCPPLGGRGGGRKEGEPEAGDFVSDGQVVLDALPPRDERVRGRRGPQRLLGDGRLLRGGAGG